MASSIMTTDTKPKVAYEEIIGDELIKISGISKRFRNDSSKLSNYVIFHFY